MKMMNEKGEGSSLLPLAICFTNALIPLGPTKVFNPEPVTTSTFTPLFGEVYRNLGIVKVLPLILIVAEGFAMVALDKSILELMPVDFAVYLFCASWRSFTRAETAVLFTAFLKTFRASPFMEPSFR